MEQDNNGKEIAKLGAKVALKAATAPIKTAIITAVGVILPYILIGAVIFIVILCVYFGTLEQIDEVLEDSTEWGERIGNAISLYGFKTNEDLENDEEGKFFDMLNLYKKVFKFDNYELSIINQTLLYEGSNEERVYLSEKPENYTDKDPDNSKIPIDMLDSEGNVSGSTTFWSFIKNIMTNYQRGFFSTYGGQSQYVKANKNMLVNAAALKRCALLTRKDKEKEEQCYNGYLIAEYNFVTDFLIDCSPLRTPLLCPEEKKIKTDVEPGFLVLPNDILGATAGTTNEILDLASGITNYFASFTIFAGVTKRFTDFVDNVRDALTLFVLGRLANEDDKHFYYDGYIVNNLKETYKVYNNINEYDNNDYLRDKFNYVLSFVDNLNANNSGALQEAATDVLSSFDKEIVEKERKNRRKTAVDIMNMVESYYELTYGKEKIEKKFSEIVASNESKASVVIDSDGNAISFDDYVLMYALSKYSNEIQEIVDSGVNVEERLRTLMIVARTQVYTETGFNHSSAEVNGNNSVYEDGKKIYDAFKADSKMYKYLANLNTSIVNSRGRTIKVNGQVITLTDEQISQVLDSVQAGGKLEDSIANVIPDASLNVTFSPLPTGSFRISSHYGEVRGSEHHNAIDYAAPTGTQIYSISDGVVANVVSHCTVGDTECGGGFGNRVYVRYNTGDGHDYYVIYGHMSSTANISVGQTISAGTLIGYVGNTGYSTGSHLHLEVRKDDTSSGAYAIDPSTLFDMSFGG